MPASTGRPATLRRAIARAGRDADFRAHVLEDGRDAQTEEGLGDDDWRALVEEVERIERTLRRDPLVATEVDHGEADAASLKG